MAGDSLSKRRGPSTDQGAVIPTTLLLRRLPRGTTNEAVRTMLLFAKDLHETEIVPNEYPEDGAFATAIARFSSVASASEAQAMLDGKPNTAGQANMIVEMKSNSAIGSSRRGTTESSVTHGMTQALSPPPTHALKSSRFNDTFQSLEKLSPPPSLGPHLDGTTIEIGAQLPKALSPRSPAVNGVPRDGSRISGKSVIGEEGGDDDTGELLKNPRAYMTDDSNGSQPSFRVHANSRMPITALGALSLNTNTNGPGSNGHASPRSTYHTNTPGSAFSPGGYAYHATNNQYLRHNYPPVNPADQNPPCNTLYVGNLPMDASEDELKAMFSKQRGYKRLCFRTKQNGPMCFVEFEDISFATKALNELYGAQLHNSVKGGIRLSFSKNPLGVRSGQPGSANSAIPLSPTASMMGAMSPLSANGFSTVAGPPPGLSAPPGLGANGTTSPGIPTGQFASQGFAFASPTIPGSRGLPLGHTNGAAYGGAMYPDYMMGR